MRWLVWTKLGNKINVLYRAVNCFKIHSNSSFYQLFLICNFDLADVAERLWSSASITYLCNTETNP